MLREDFPKGDSTRRWHHIIKKFQPQKNFAQKSNFVFLGFACDEGIKRNGGRLGAKLGPTVLRQTLLNLPVHFSNSTQLWDAGDVACSKNNLENAQAQLGQGVAQILKNKGFPILLGGGHEIAFGHYLGLRAAFPKKKIGIINFDAHFDLRPTDLGANSGTPFLQIAKDCQQLKVPFRYLCLGIQREANTAHLFETAQKLKTEFVLAEDVCEKNLKSLQTKIKKFIQGCDGIYVTICLDAFAQAFAPGVSAPTPFGLEPKIVRDLLRFIKAQKKTIALDVAELNPSLDRDNQTAKLAAHLIFDWVM